jgi:hypothetical protein
MEEWNELDFEQVQNQGPLLVQETFAPTEQANNPLSINTKSIQPIQPKPIKPVSTRPIYIFPKMLIAYV